eukprot:3781455-Pyramimonas_sp.AAC.1
MSNSTRDPREEGAQRHATVISRPQSTWTASRAGARRLGHRSSASPIAQVGRRRRSSSMRWAWRLRIGIA